MMIKVLPRWLSPQRGRRRILGTGGVAIAALLLAASAGAAMAHSGDVIRPSGETGWALAWSFSGYGAKHILLGYDHLLFLAGLALLTTQLRHLVGVAGLFALAYSATLVGGTLAGIALPGLVIDGVIAASVGFVGAQVAFAGEARWLPPDPRPAALGFGLAHGLGLSTLLQELRLKGDDLLPSILGFNLGVELGQLAALGLFLSILAGMRAFPFPERQRIPAGFALGSASLTLLVLLVVGVDL
jgi:hypothetical protein